MQTFVATYRTELLMQSLLFVLSAGVYLWFFGSLRSFLLRAEGKPGRISTIAFGAGVSVVGMQLVFQSVQVALALGADEPGASARVGMLSDLAYALSVIAYVPMAIVLAAVAVVSFRTRAFPVWVGWLSAIVSAMNLCLTAGIVMDSGPLVPGGGLTYGRYLLMVVWLLVVTTIMVMRLGQQTSSISDTRGE
jgi:hypothetical protein